MPTTSETPATTAVSVSEAGGDLVLLSWAAREHGLGSVEGVYREIAGALADRGCVPLL